MKAETHLQTTLQPRADADAAAGTRAAAHTRVDPDCASKLQSGSLSSGLLAPGDRVVVALSGGLDSVTLLHLLRFSFPQLELRITAAHYDHAMREDSADDARWVTGLCRAWRVSLVRGRARSVLASEAQARSARYRFLRSVLRAKGARFIVTAHHADDQIETVLFRIMRGAGTRGLAGMREQHADVLRPLLSIHRADIEAYARAAGIRHRTDASNADVRFARNRLRHDVVPQLDALLPGTARRLLDVAHIARAQERAWKPWVRDALRDVAEPLKNGAFELALPQFLAYHPEVGARVIRALVRRLGCALDRARTQAAVQFIRSASSGSVLEAGGGIELHKSFDRITIARARSGEAALPDEGVSIAGAGTGSALATFGGRRFTFSWSVPEGHRFPLELRAWRAGDRMRLAYGTKKLKKLFAELRIARTERGHIPVLVDAHDTVVWVRDVGMAADIPLAAQTTFQITESDAENG